MDFSVWPTPWSWPEIRDVALVADRGGWHGIWVADHFMPPFDASGSSVEPWSVIGALGAMTEHLRLGSLVCSVTYRHPSVLASAACSADHVSGGRVVLGIGAGWQKNEHVAYGIPLGTLRERSDRLEEAADVLRSLLNETTTDFTGTHFTFTDAHNEPKPVGGSLPLLVGGKGEQRTLRTAARYADEWNGWCTADEMRAKREVLARHAEAADRDPSSIRCSTQAFVCMSEDPAVVDAFAAAAVGRPTLVGSTDSIVEQVAAFAAAGADEIIVPDWLIADPAERIDHYEQFRSDVIDVVNRP